MAGFYGQMARLLESGVALTEALRLMSEHSRGRLSDCVKNLQTRIESGSTLPPAMSKEPSFFADHVISLVEAGEETGGLPAVFLALSESLELRLNMRRRMLRACVYPFILFTLSFFLIPISRLFTAGVGGYLQASLVPYLISLGVLALVLFGLPLGFKKVLGPASTQAISRKLPVIGKLQVLRSTVSFSRHLSTALRAGLDIHTSLHLSARATGDFVVVKRIERASSVIRTGSTLAAALTETGLFDDEFMLAVSAGEVSGRLENALDQQARLRQDTFIHRLEVTVQLSAVAVLVLVYAYVAWSIMAEYQNILGGTQAQMEELMKELGGEGADLDGLLKQLGKPAGYNQLPADLKDLLP
jgi:type II secretory pathway component PulF